MGGRDGKDDELDDGECIGVTWALIVGRGSGRTDGGVGVTGVTGSDGTIGNGRCLRGDD